MANAWILKPLVPATIAMGGGGPTFDFTAGALPSGATLTRASVGTCVDITGAMVSRAANVARFDYDPSTHAALGILIEPAATNLIPNSNDLTASSPTNTALTVMATTLRETTASSAHFSSRTNLATIVSGQSYVWSFIASEASASPKRYLTIRPETSFTVDYPLASIDLATGVASLGTVASSGGFTVVTKPLAGGKWLVEMRGGISDGTIFGTILLSDNVSLATGSFVGSVTSGFDITDMQLELGSIATSRIPTTGSTATRAADVLTLNWGALGVANGTYSGVYTFDDGTTQTLSLTVASGTSTVPTNLNRPRITSIALAGVTSAPDVGVAANLTNDYAGVIAQASCSMSPNNSAQIVIDLGADTSIDTIMVFGVELFPTTGTLTVNYATAAQGAFTGAFSTDATGVPYAGSAAMTSGKGVSLWSVAAPITARYVQLLYNAGSGVSGKSVRASRVVIGKRVQLQRNFAYGAVAGVRDLGSLDFSARAVLLRRRARKLRTIALTFSNARKDEVETTVKPLLEQVGNTELVAVVTDPAADAQRQNRCYFGPIVGDLGATWRNAAAWETKINVVSIF